MFGLYIGEPMSIPYNMFGHIAVISMAFVTWGVFKQSNRIYGPRAGTEDWLRMPDRSMRKGIEDGTFFKLKKDFMSRYYKK